MRLVIRVFLFLTIAVLVWTSRMAIAAPEATEPGVPGQSAPIEGTHHAEPEGELIPVKNIPQAMAQAIWVLIIFAILLAILYPTAWKGVLAGLKSREEHIRKSIAEAEATRAKAEETLKQYNQQLAAAEDRVRELIAKAQADGERLAATIRDKASGEAEGIKKKALSDIEEASKNAIIQIHDQAAELSTAIAEKIIRKNLNVEDQRELVRASLQQLEAGRN